MKSRAALTIFSAMMMATFANTGTLRAEDNVIALPPAGHTIVNLSVTERTKLEQDTLSGTLNYQLDGASASEIQDKINKAVTEALAEAKKATDVKTTTGSYYVYEFNDQSTIDPRTGRPFENRKTWRGQQSISLESKDSAALLELAGKIQTLGFTMQGLNYSLSPEKADTVRDSLMEKGLKSLGARAKLAADALGKNGFDIIDVNIDGSERPYPVMYRNMAKMEMAAASADSMAAPVAEAGETDVTMTLNARILLKP